ncbi:hypothetical protein LPU83_pLPU83b_0582 (plasmid) [Rhizobium favelukesii]|uniref:Uncharacterized protein n=1 Tax=Rhizobium favelukesii TaxID=348824 RepID=W6RHA4_9HYPH|nr:hypothetical protein LPU83_pLPU83b_0582 [Rhizobium favelukesii]
MSDSYAPRLFIAQDRKAITFIQIGAPGEGSRVQHLPIKAAKANIDILRTRRHPPMAGVDFKQATCRNARALGGHLQASDCDNLIAYERLGHAHLIGMIWPKV